MRLLRSLELEQNFSAIIVEVIPCSFLSCISFYGLVELSKKYIHDPLLVHVSSGSFDEYLKSLAKTGKKNFNYVKKHNSDLLYSRMECDLSLIENFMALWEQQDKKGGKGTWGFGSGFVEFLMKKGLLLCFVVRQIDNPDNIIALHFVEKHADYVYCHPPMFDKEKYNE